MKIEYHDLRITAAFNNPGGYWAPPISNPQGARTYRLNVRPGVEVAWWIARQAFANLTRFQIIGVDVPGGEVTLSLLGADDRQEAAGIDIRVFCVRNGTLDSSLESVRGE